LQKQIGVAQRPQHAHDFIVLFVNLSLRHVQPVDGIFLERYFRWRKHRCKLPSFPKRECFRHLRRLRRIGMAPSSGD
jgi:hypothetical protein